MNEAQQTPLIDLLRNVPVDARAEYEHGPTHHSNIPYGRLCSEAADEITRLRAEVERLTAENDMLAKAAAPATVADVVALERDMAELERLRAEVEQLRVQLAGCSVVALANTQEGAARARPAKGEYGWSPALQDVADAVDREMRLRADVKRLRAIIQDWLDAEDVGNGYNCGVADDDLLERTRAVIGI